MPLVQAGSGLLTRDARLVYAAKHAKALRRYQYEVVQHRPQVALGHFDYLNVRPHPLGYQWAPGKMHMMPLFLVRGGGGAGGGGGETFQGLTPTVEVDTVGELNTELASATAGTIIGLLPAVYTHSTGGSPYTNNTPAFNPANDGTSGSPIIIVGKYDPTEMATPLSDSNRSELRAGSGSYSGSDSHPVFGSDNRDYIRWINIVCDEAQCRTKGDNGPAYIANCTGVRIDHCVIKGSTDASFSGDNHNGVRIGEAPSTELDHQVTNCIIYNFTVGFGQNAAGIMTYGGQNITFDNNEIYDCTTAIFVKGSGGSGATLNYGNIRYNHVHDTEAGIKVQAIDASNNLVIQHNVTNALLYSVAGESLTRNIKATRNSLVQDGDESGDSAPLYVTQFTGNGCEFNDNIVYCRVSSTYYMDGSGYTQNNFAAYDYNGFYGSSAGTKWKWNGTNIADITNLHSNVATSNNNQILGADPFTDAANDDFTVTGAALTASSTGGPIGADWSLVGPT